MKLEREGGENAREAGELARKKILASHFHEAECDYR